MKTCLICGKELGIKDTHHLLCDKCREVDTIEPNGYTRVAKTESIRQHVYSMAEIEELRCAI